MQLIEHADGFDLRLGDRLIVRHRTAAPMAFVGRGEPSVRMRKGHFQIDDYVTARIPLTQAVVMRSRAGVRIALSAEASEAPSLVLLVQGEADAATIAFEAADPSLNRLWLRFVAEPGERLWGGGEQLSYFDLAGRRYPMWTR